MVGSNVLEGLKEGRDVPERMLDSRPRLELPATKELPLCYSRFTALGAVVARGDGSSFLWSEDVQAISDAIIAGLGGIWGPKKELNDPLQFTVGATAHYLLPGRWRWSGTTEWLRRINQVDIIAYGQPATPRRQPKAQRRFAPDLSQT